MYYYLDEYNNFQGPYSERAYAKWYADKMIPEGTLLYDENRCSIAIDRIVEKLLKSRTKIMFQEDSMIGDKTIDQTDLDVTIDINQTYRPNDTTTFQADFTQLDDGVDEVDFPKGAENDVHEARLQKMIGMYVDRRALFNRRRRFPDNYVPFEFSWSRWVPHSLKIHEALRGSTHLHNCLQEFDPELFSNYLATLNIKNHPCQRCHVRFDNSHEMLTHFVSVPHVHRLFTQDPSQVLSMIDVHCIQKMMSEVELLEEEVASNVHLEPFKQSDMEDLFFETADISQAFDSLKSTVQLMQRVPLLDAPRDSADCCEYIETLILFRALELNYSQTLKPFRHRRLGIDKDTKCSYCNVTFDATYLEAVPHHLLSEEHIRNSLALGVSRSEMEYWLAFLRAIVKGNNASDWRFLEPAGVSLQESDFPLCYNLGELSRGDFVYSGADVDPVLNFVRNKIRGFFPLLNDCKYRTSCRWCQVELCSTYGVLRHVLYDKCHVDRLENVSNDDLRRLLKVLHLHTTMPLFQQTTCHQTAQQPLLDATEKREAMQMVTNVAWLKHKRREIRKTAARSFPMGLVNRCEVCGVDIEHFDGVVMHLCSEEHGLNVINNARIADADFDYWMSVFNVKSGRRSR